MKWHSPFRSIFLFLFSLSLSVHVTALVVNTSAAIHQDPNNYLGLNGLTSLGDAVSGEFNFSGLSPQTSFNYLPGRTEHFLQPNGATSTIIVNGTPIADPGTTYYTVTIFNDVIVDGLGFGDFYSVNQFFGSPDPAYTELAWIIGFFDSTGTAHSNSDFYELSSTAAFDQISISGILVDAINQTQQTLFYSELQPVPLPPTAWLFASAIACLINLRNRAS